MGYVFKGKTLWNFFRGMSWQFYNLNLKVNTGILCFAQVAQGSQQNFQEREMGLDVALTKTVDTCCLSDSTYTEATPPSYFLEESQQRQRPLIEITCT